MNQEAVSDPSIQIKDNADSRFYCQKEANARWTVWDRLANEPAKLGGRELVGCAYDRASAAESVLTQIYSRGLDAEALLLRPARGRETPKTLEASTTQDAEDDT